MKSLLKRPLVYSLAVYFILAFPFTLFSVSNKTAGMIFSAVLSFILLISSLLFYLIGKPRSRKSFHPLLLFLFLLSFSVFLSFFTAYCSQDLTYERLTEKYSGSYGAKLRIENAVKSESIAAYTARLTEKEGERVNEDVLIHITSANDLSLSVGDTVTADITAERIKLTPENLQLYLCEGVYLSGVMNDQPRVLEMSKLSLIYRIREHVKGCLETYMSDRTTALALAVILGDRSMLSDRMQEGFAALGISHVLAVSGLHLSALSGAVLLLCSRFRVRRIYRVIGCISFSFLFALITGFSPSVSRALGMLTVFMLSSLSGRKYDPISSLFFAALIICLASPFAILDVSLILSFLAVFGVLTLGKASSSSLKKLIINKYAYSRPRLCRLLIGISSSLCITVGATVATLPATVYYFGSTSLISPLSNLILLPLVAPMLILFMVFALLSFFPLPAILALISFATKGPCSAIFFSADLACKRKLLLAGLDYPFIPLLLSLLIALSFILAASRKRAALIPVLFLIFSALLTPVTQLYDHTERNERIITVYSTDTSDTLYVKAGNEILIFLLNGTDSNTDKVLSLIKDDSSDKLTSLVIPEINSDNINFIKGLASLSGGSIKRILTSEENEVALKAQYALDRLYGISVIFADDISSSLHDVEINVYSEKYRDDPSAMLVLLRVGNMRAAFANESALYLPTFLSAISRLSENGADVYVSLDRENETEEAGDREPLQILECIQGRFTLLYKENEYIILDNTKNKE